MTTCPVEQRADKGDVFVPLSMFAGIESLRSNRGVQPSYWIGIVSCKRPAILCIGGVRAGDVGVLLYAVVLVIENALGSVVPSIVVEVLLQNRYLMSGGIRANDNRDMARIVIRPDEDIAYKRCIHVPVCVLNIMPGMRVPTIGGVRPRIGIMIAEILVAINEFHALKRVAIAIPIGIVKTGSIGIGFLTCHQRI